MNFYDINGINDSSVASRLYEYSQKSEDELMDELKRKVADLKASGSFDVSTLENFYLTASPFLDDVQKRRMRSIIDALKD